jgi:DNA-binding NtrC family response regulator
MDALEAAPAGKDTGTEGSRTLSAVGSVVLVSAGSDHQAAAGAVAPLAESVLVVDSPDSLSSAGCSPSLVLLFQSQAPSADLKLLSQVRDHCSCPVVVVCDQPVRADHAVKFVRAGAYDYIQGPLSESQAQSLLAGMAREGLFGGAVRGRFFCDDCAPGVEMVGRSAAMTQVMETTRLVAQSRCNPILILGPTGVGKELIAESVNAWRHGQADRMVAINCAALTASLLESELFGHVRGAFTGADRDKVGLFELAQDGSLFLDEISEMPLELQAKLLRVLQERRFRRVGGTSDRSCRATVIASSNRDLLKEVEAGRFRRDLYYRLAVFPIVVPPLQSPQRQQDILLLAEFFLESLGEGPAPTLSPAAQKMLLGHPWPGNVRELRNVMERALILNRSSEIGPENIRFDTSGPLAPAAGGAIKDLSLETAEREFILRALQETGWQRTRAAALLGITRATLHAKLKRYDIQPPQVASTASPSIV